MITPIFQVSADGHLGGDCTVGPFDGSGATFIIAVGAFVSTVPSLVDSEGNVYVPLDVPNHEPVAGHRQFFCFFPVVAPAMTITLGAGFAHSLCVMGFAGSSPVAAYHTNIVGNGAASAAALKPGPLTPPPGETLLISGFSTNNNSGSPDAVIDVPSGFTLALNQQAEASSNAGSALAWKVGTGAAEDPEWSQPGNSALSVSLASFSVPAAGTRLTQLVALIVQDRAPDPPVVAPPTGGGTPGVSTDPNAGVDICDAPVIVGFADLTPPGASAVRYSQVPINREVQDYPYVKTFGDVVRGLTSREGGTLRGTRVSALISDLTRQLRGAESTNGLVGALLEYFASTPPALLAHETSPSALNQPRRLFSGLVTSSDPEKDFGFRVHASDWLQRLLDLDPPPRYPRRLFTTTDFSGMNNDPKSLTHPGNPLMLGKPVPVGYGLLSDEAKGLSAVGVVPGIFTGTRYIPFFAQDWDEFVFFAHAPASFQSLFIPIGPGLSSGPGVPAREKVTAATLPIATDVLAPWHGEWASAFGSAAPYRDFNGRRYCVAYLRGPRGTLARTGQVALVANLGGVEDVGDGSGDLIDSLALQVLHFFVNWVLGDYQSGAWLSSPTIGGYSVVNSASFTTCQTRSEARVPTAGHIGAFLAGWDQLGWTLQEFARLVYEHLIYLGQNKDGQLIGAMIDPAAAAVRTLSDVTDTREKTFQAGRVRTQIKNYFPHRYGRLYTPPLSEPTPTVGNALPTSLRQPTPEWDVDNLLDSVTASINDHGRRELNLSLELTRDAATAVDIKNGHKELLPTGPMVARVEDGPCATNVELGKNIALTHQEGIDASGWTARKLMVERHTVHMDMPNAFAVELESLDVENLP